MTTEIKMVQIQICTQGKQLNNDGTNNPRETSKPDNPLKGMHNIVPQKLDNPLKGVRNVVLKKNLKPVSDMFNRTNLDSNKLV